MFQCNSIHNCEHAGCNNLNSSLERDNFSAGRAPSEIRLAESPDTAALVELITDTVEEMSIVADTAFSGCAAVHATTNSGLDADNLRLRQRVLRLRLLGAYNAKVLKTAKCSWGRVAPLPFARAPSTLLHIIPEVHEPIPDSTI